VQDVEAWWKSESTGGVWLLAFEPDLEVAVAVAFEHHGQDFHRQLERRSLMRVPVGGHSRIVSGPAARLRFEAEAAWDRSDSAREIQDAVTLSL
jgi:hypothetical protein